MGTVYEIKEPSLLDYIKGKLAAMQANGDMARFEKEMQEKTEKKVREPDPVPGIVHTVKARSWLYDPTITVQEDLKDQDGRVFHRAGEKVNPLDKINLSKAMIFIDGADEKQVVWALKQDKQKSGNTKIILTSGPVIDLMKTNNHRFYFDQEGKLTGKFGIKQVPAIVSQEGKQLRIKEVLL